MQPIELEIDMKVFISYAHADKELYKKLEEHLSSLLYSGKITIWQYQEIPAGANWEDQINTHLNEADIILLLISASFMASKYCWNKEVQAALQRHKEGTAQVVPIILKPALWQDTPLGQIQALPRDAKPVTLWGDPDAAFEDVARGIRDIVEHLRIKLREDTERNEKISVLMGEIEGFQRSLISINNDIKDVYSKILQEENKKKDIENEVQRINQSIDELKAKQHTAKDQQLQLVKQWQETNKHLLALGVTPIELPAEVSVELLVEDSAQVPARASSKLSGEREEPLSLSGTTSSMPMPKSRYPTREKNEHRVAPRQVFTALDIGTALAKAIIIEVVGDQAEVLGVGYCPQSYAHMSDGIVTDIPSVIANCNEALLKAQKAAGGLIAHSAVIGIAGELVKGSSMTVSRQRPQPTKPITSEELDGLITAAQQRSLKSAKERIAAETGYENIDVHLTNASVISVRIDGQVITNPIGFKGRHFSLTLFSAFAPLTQLGVVESIARGLDLAPFTIIAEPYALARCLAANAGVDSGAIFIDVGAGTTDIAVVRQGGIEETRMFALGGRAFTHRIATHKGISLKDAERIKISYSNGKIKSPDQEEIQAILAVECQTWMDIVELLINEISKGELLPPAIYIVGGGSELPDLYERLTSFPWTERLLFSRQPIIRTLQPEMVPNIIDWDSQLTTAQDITPMALAYQAVELLNQNDVLRKALDRVINTTGI